MVRPLDYQMGIEDDVLDQLRKVLETAVKEIETELSGKTKDLGVGERLTRANAEAIKRAASAHLTKDWGDIRSILSGARESAAKAATRAYYEQLEGPLKELLGDEGYGSLVEAQAQMAASRINTVMARLSASRRSLSSQVWKTRALTNGWLDNKVNQALARGWDANRLAKEVLGFVDPNTPGGASYAAKRLARTEINNAFHSQTMEQMRRSGVTEYTKWNLSGSHPPGSDCLCEEYADHRISKSKDDPTKFLDDPEDEYGVENTSLNIGGTDVDLARSYRPKRMWDDEDPEYYSGSEHLAMSQYTSADHFFKMREAFRDGRPYPLRDQFSDKDSALEAFEELNRVADRTTLSSAQKLHRAMSVSPEWIEGLEAGDLILHDFYASTTLEASKAKEYGSSKVKGNKNVLLNILAPKGAHVIPGAEGLQELVLPPNSQMRIRRISKISGKTIIVVDLGI